MAKSKTLTGRAWAKSRAKPAAAKRPKARALSRAKAPPVVSSKKRPAKKAAARRAHGSAFAFESVARSAPRVALIHDRDRNVHFAGFGKLRSEVREAAVQHGLPARFLTEALETLGVSRAKLLDSLGIASSTAARVAHQGRPFSPADSERLALLARLWDQVLMVYEDEAGARAWLTGQVPSAGGVPLRQLKTHEGFERAERAILQLAYGVYA